VGPHRLMWRLVSSMIRISRIANVFLLALVTAGLLSCTSPVNPVKEDSSSVTLSFRVPTVNKPGIQAFGPPPSGITEIEVIITGDGMTPITDSITGLSGGVVSRTYSVPSGSNRIFAALAYEAASPPLKILSYSGQPGPANVNIHGIRKTG